MSEEPQHSAPPVSDSEAHRAKTLESAGWGALLVWLGIVTLLPIGWAVFLIGLGVIVLALQGLRVKWGLKPENFWLILGAVFIVAGITESFGTGLPLVPLALIAFGVAALYDVYQRIQKHH